MLKTLFQANFEKLDEELNSINQNTKALQKNHVQLLDMKAVLGQVKSLLDSVSFSSCCTNPGRKTSIWSFVASYREDGLASQKFALIIMEFAADQEGSSHVDQ